MWWHRLPACTAGPPRICLQRRSAVTSVLVNPNCTRCCLCHAHHTSTSLHAVAAALLLAGTLPVEYAGLSKLHSLWLFSNRLTGQLPAAYSAMTALEDLQVSYNKFSGEAELYASCRQHTARSWWLSACGRAHRQVCPCRTISSAFLRNKQQGVSARRYPSRVAALPRSSKHFLGCRA